MYTVYYDSGTTNTRAYLLQDRQLIGRKSIAVGSRDSAQINGTSYLLQQLYQLYLDLLDECSLSNQQIDSIYMSGMISSPSGIIEIPHIPTPVNARRLKDEIVSYFEAQFFHRDIFIIPGIKTIQSGESISFDNIEHVNNMRGEEIELLGITHTTAPDLPALQAIILPGSHTQIAFMEQDRIVDILSTITGELFHAILEETLIGSSLKPTDSWQLDKVMVQKGYQCLKTYGFNRAIYLIRTMDLFLDSTLSQRISFMEGVLNGGVIDAIDQKLSFSRHTQVHLGVTGDSIHSLIFQAIAESNFPGCTIVPLIPADHIPYSVSGLLALLDS